MTLYREATDECVQGYGHSMMDSKCVGCGARNVFVVPVEPDIEAYLDRLDSPLNAGHPIKVSDALAALDAALGIGGSE